MQQPTRKLGLALSGAAARSVFYVGFLEVLQEEGVRVDVISAQSGASIVAAAYACGTLDRLKKEMFALDWGKLRGLMVRSKRGGLFSLSRAEEYLRAHITKSAHFENLQTRLVFGATNLHTGRVVPLAMGDVAHAICTTCSVPGLFEPIQWGNQSLVDGGVLSVLPAQLAREAGATTVLGVSVRSTKHVFLPSHIKLRRAYNLAKQMVLKSTPARLIRAAKRVVSPDGMVGYFESVPHDEFRADFTLLRAVTRSLDLAIDVTKTESLSNDAYLCDYMIHEGNGNYGDSVKISQTERLYQDGRQSALYHLDAIKKLIAE